MLFKERKGVMKTSIRKSKSANYYVQQLAVNVVSGRYLRHKLNYVKSQSTVNNVRKQFDTEHISTYLIDNLELTLRNV